MASYCHWAVRGRDAPAEVQALRTRPEQSNEDGPVPPHRYGFPSCARANPIAVAAAAESGAGSDAPIPDDDCARSSARTRDLSAASAAYASWS